jgi:pilus assembly protein CpaB
VDVYTLEVSPEDGEKLALAATQGKLQFALRHSTDSETVLTKGATIKDTLASYKHQVKSSAKKSRPHRAAPFSVQVIKGNDSKTVKF